MAITNLCYAAIVALLVLSLIYREEILKFSPAGTLRSFHDALGQAPLQVYAIFPLYVLGLAVGTLVVPGHNHLGVPTKAEPGAKDKEGKRYNFKINGLRLTLITVGCTLATKLLPPTSPFYITSIYDHIQVIFIMANIAALSLSTFLFLKGRFANKGTGHFTEDFVMGTELMPHLGPINWKFFWLRPSMALWLLINISALAKQYDTLGFVTPRMVLYQLFTFAYVFDYFWHEEKMTSTWDIIAENFGLMLVWGDIVFIPFAFSLQVYYLINDVTPISNLEIALIVAVFVTGYIIFRGSNSQKHNFKHHPELLIWGKKPEVVGKLLVSGWWGLARHVNYLGDIILGVAYCLPCGTAHLVPWIYPIYLTLLLVHRFVRDDNRCREKYGQTWEQYCKRVPYRIIPYVW